MKHSDIRRNLSAYLDDSVTPEERTIIKEHLESCRECRAALEELRKTAEYVRGIEEVEPPAWLAGKIIARAREEAERKKSIFSRLFFPLHVKLSIEVAALVVVTFTGYLVFRVTQPEMDLVGTPEKRESRNSLPSTAAPSAPPVAAPAQKQLKEDTVVGKRGENVLSRKPSERKPEPVATDKQLPASAPETGFAPAPGAKSIPPEFEPSDMIRKKEDSSSSALQAERSMRASGMSEEGKVEQDDNLSAKRKAIPQREKAEANVSFVLRAADRASLESDIEHLVARLGGRVVKREWSAERRAITISIDGRRLDFLRQKLGSFGEVTGKGMGSGSVNRNGNTTVLVEVQAE